MSRNVIVAGVGMVPFTKPGASETYDVMVDSTGLHMVNDRRAPPAAPR